MKLSAKLELRDLWVGLFWDRKPAGLQIVVCPVPMLAITLLIPHGRPPRRRAEPHPCKRCGGEAWFDDLYCCDCGANP